MAYSEAFCYLGPFVQEREKLIEDGNEDEIDHDKSNLKEKVIELTKRCKQRRFE